MEILLLLCMLRISRKYSNEEYTSNFYLDVIIQCLHIIVFVMLSVLFISKDNFFSKFFFFVDIFIIYNRVKELILDLIFNHEEKKKNENGDNNKKER